jgi:hypothetical protein
MVNGNEWPSLCLRRDGERSYSSVEYPVAPVLAKSCDCRGDTHNETPRPLDDCKEVDELATLLASESQEFARDDDALEDGGMKS